MKVKAAVLREVTKGYSIEELELEPPKAGEALVKYAYTGYCHSDLTNMMGRLDMALPMVAGHECAGVVEAVGEGVTRVKVGDHVVGTWMIPCGKCPECRSGRGNVCTGTFPQFVAGTMLDGTTRYTDAEGNVQVFDSSLTRPELNPVQSYDVEEDTTALYLQANFKAEGQAGVGRPRSTVTPGEQATPAWSLDGEGGLR